MTKYSTTNHKDLMALGFPEHTARDIIKQAKRIAVRQYNERVSELSKSQRIVVKYPCSPFDNPRVGIAPTSIVEMLLGFPLTNEKGSD